jgi:hypothetical protein
MDFAFGDGVCRVSQPIATFIWQSNCQLCKASDHQTLAGEKLYFGTLVPRLGRI